MNRFLRTLRSTYIKEMRVWRRNSRQLMLVILSPLMFWTGFALLMGGVYSVGIDAALVVQETNPGFYTDALIETLGEPDDIPPSLNLIPMTEEAADLAFENGDLMLIITIPSGFENSIATNESTSIHIRVNNAHEDMTKNLRMPVIRKLDIYYQTYLPQDAIVDFEYESIRDYTYSRLAYMAWTISIYSVMFASMYIAGSTVTQEFEQQTLEEIKLSNQSPSAIYMGKMLSGVSLSYLAVPILLGASFLMYGVWPRGDLLSYLVLTIPLGFACAAVGVILGSLFRNSVYIVPIAAIGSVFYWMTGGGIAPLQLIGLTFGVMDSYAPVSNVYRSLIEMFIDGTYSTLPVDFLVVTGFAVVFVALFPILAERISQIDYSQRINALRERRKKRGK